MSLKRLTSILERWLWIVVYAALSGGLVAVARPVIGRLESQVILAVAPLPAELVLFLCGAVPAILLAVVVRRGSSGLLKPRHFVTYPPAWFAAVLAFVVLLLFDKQWVLGANAAWGREETTPMFLWLIGGFGAVWLSVLIVKTPSWISDLGSARSAGNKHHETRGTFEELSHKPERLFSWIENDSPVDHPSLDLFGHRLVARRIARRLYTDQPHAHVPTFDLLGRFGSGKSSIVNLVEYYVTHPDELDLPRLPLWRRILAPRPRILVCRVSVWGFNSFGAVLRHITNGIIRKLATEVDCTALGRISDSLSESLAAGGGWWAPIIRLASRRRSPEEILRCLGKVLDAAGVRIVVCVEDAERNESPSAVHDSSQSGRTVMRLAEGLFDRLQHVAGVGYVLTGNLSPRDGVDYARLVRFSEDVPDLDRLSVWRTLSVLRNKALAAASIIDPSEHEHAKVWLDPDNPMAEALVTDDEMLSGSIVVAAGTPRTLKMAMRAAWESWTHDGLRGEIDFDDLLVAAIVRFGMPNVWNVVRTGAQFFRYTEGNLSPAQQSFARDLNENLETASAADGVRLHVALRLLGFLFPQAAPEFNLSVIQRDPLQGVSASGANDYWARLLRGELEKEELRDQEVLRAIKCWVAASEDNSFATDYVTSHDFRTQAIHFANMIPNGRVLELLDETFAVFGTLPDSYPESMHLVYDATKLLSKRPPEPRSKYPDWLAMRLRDAVKVSVELVQQMLHRLASVETMGPLIDDAGRSDCFKVVCSEMAARLKGKPRVLLRTLRGCRAAALREIIGWTEAGGRSESVPSDLRGFGDTLLEAYELDRKSVYPVLIALIGEQRPTPTKVGVREQWVEELFTDCKALWQAVQAGDPAWAVENGFFDWARWLGEEAERRLAAVEGDDPRDQP